MDIQAAIAVLTNGENLSKEDMSSVVRQIMSGRATDAQMGVFDPFEN